MGKSHVHKYGKQTKEKKNNRERKTKWMNERQTHRGIQDKIPYKRRIKMTNTTLNTQ